MKIRAVIFDVYGTLLEVGPPVIDPEVAWSQLCRAYLDGPALSWADFQAGTREWIARDHAVARGRGVMHPEVCWPEVVVRALPAAQQLSPEALAAFLQGAASVGRQVRLAEGAGPLLQNLAAAGVLLGIASNAQAYTLGEMRDALAGQGTTGNLFHPSLCCWSFENGFSKPDPHVFQLLSARLKMLGIEPGDTWMLGDRLDNDVEPARAFGWQAWHVQPESGRDLRAFARLAGTALGWTL